MKRSYTAVLQFNVTGEERSIKYEMEALSDSTWGYSDEEYTDMIANYMLTEGNLECDCNRFTYMFPEVDEDFPCGSEKFKLVDLVSPEGESILGKQWG